MAVQPIDHLPEGENDPLRDEPSQSTPPEPQPDPALDQAPQPTGEPVAEADPTEVDWKKRYDDVRREQMQGLETARRERDEAFRTRDQALQIARKVYEDTQRASQQQRVEYTSDELKAEAANLGITDEQLDFMLKLNQQTASERVGQFEQRYAQDQQQALQQQALQQSESAIANVREEFARAHPDALEHGPEILEFMRSVGAVEEERDPQGNPTGRMSVMIDNFSIADLEAAWEAVQNEDLQVVLKANPNWYWSSEGMDYARRQVEADKQRASLAELLQNAQPVTTPQVDARREAALAAAETLPASGGPPPASGGQPRDEFDEVLQYQQGKRKSVFSS